MQEQAGRPKRAGRWARHVTQLKLAQTLIRLMRTKAAASDAGDSDGDDDDDCADISQAENLLESYFAMVSSSEAGTAVGVQCLLRTAVITKLKRMVSCKGCMHCTEKSALQAPPPSISITISDLRRGAGGLSHQSLERLGRAHEGC